jgi:hypothetical protein
MIRIKDVRINNADGLFKKELCFSLEASKYFDLTGNQLVLKYNVDDISCLADPAIFSLLPSAYWGKTDIVLDGHLKYNKEIQENIFRLCEVWNKFFDLNRFVRLHGGDPVSTASDDSSTKGTGLLFSGGVDSLATFADLKDEISHLIFFYGADIIKNEEKFDYFCKYFQDFATHFEKQMILISTNIRSITSAPWGEILHGCAFLGPTLALPGYLNKVLISSSFYDDIAEKHPWGSTLVTDKFISNALVKVEHYGAHMTRLDKTKLITSYPKFLNYLRVCWLEECEGFNCGACEKCLRTMVPLLLLDVPPESVPFPKDKYNLSNIIQILKDRGKEIITFGEKCFWIEIFLGIENDIFPNKQKINIVQEVLKDIIGDFYQQYQNRKKDNSFYDQFFYTTQLRRVEIKLGLPPEALSFLRPINKMLVYLGNFFHLRKPC